MRLSVEQQCNIGANHVESVIARQGKALNIVYIYHWLNILAELLESSEVVQRFERPWRKFQSL